MTAAPVRVTVVGDTTLDVTVRGAATGSGVGSAVEAGRDRPAQIVAGPGGQGANVAIRLARRGMAVQLVTALGTDAAGRMLEEALTNEKVTILNVGPGGETPSPRSGIVVSLLDGSGERAMLSDRVSFDPAALASAAVAHAVSDAEWIHLSGYPLADPNSGDQLAALATSRPDGSRCSIGGGSFREGAALVGRLRVSRPDIVLVDRAEAAVILGRDPNGAETAVGLVASLASALDAAVVVTSGAAGAAAASSNGVIEVSEPPRAVLDATGAGDAVAASMIVALAREPWPPSLDTLRSALTAAADVGAAVAGAVGAQATIPAEASR